MANSAGAAQESPIN